MYRSGSTRQGRFLSSSSTRTLLGCVWACFIITFLCALLRSLNLNKSDSISSLYDHHRVDANALDEYMNAPKLQQQQQKQPPLQQQQQQQQHQAKNVTKIIGFADFGYMKIAHRWYVEMEELGYTEHMVAAQDSVAGDYFASKNMRYDLIFKEKSNSNNVSSLRMACDAVYKRLPNDNKVHQMYRRSLFGSRWHYVLKQLQLGYHVLLTDVDNIYTQYKPLSELHDSEFDVYHAYAGTVPSFPLNLFRLMGFTLCGGMSWLRATPSVIQFVQNITNQCGCQHLHCTCYCDDQVVLNRYIYYEYIWDDHHHNHDEPNFQNKTLVRVPGSIEEMDWRGYTGYCNQTGHRVKIWDRDVAYRAEFDENNCPNQTTNWIAMPTGLNREHVWDIWKEKCLNKNNSNNSSDNNHNSTPPKANKDAQRNNVATDSSTPATKQQPVIQSAATAQTTMKTAATTTKRATRARVVNHATTATTTTKSWSSTLAGWQLPKNTTMIIGFADANYKEIAYRWYTELEQLGYTQHMVAAQDEVAGNYFAANKMRYEYVYQHPRNNYTSLKQACQHLIYDVLKEPQQKQLYRHSLFATRWNYVWKQLQLGYHVLLTDVDNVYTQYKPLKDLEESPYDVFHAYAGTFPSYPLNIFHKMGFTVCGGMSWLRSTPAVLEFVKEIAKTCRCDVERPLGCSCYCDDQLTLNKFIQKEYIWDPPRLHVPPPKSLEEVDWNGMTGYCNSTGHRVKIWDRHVAYRAEIGQVCPNMTRNWIAMPIGLDRTTTWEGWREKCPSITNVSVAPT